MAWIPVVGVMQTSFKQCWSAQSNGYSIVTQRFPSIETVDVGGYIRELGQEESFCNPSTVEILVFAIVIT